MNHPIIITSNNKILNSLETFTELYAHDISYVHSPITRDAILRIISNYQNDFGNEKD